MWRRVTSISPMFSLSKPSLLNQEAYGLRIWQIFSTTVQKPVESGTSLKETIPFITFVLGGPGSGKGTQCARIAENFGFTHISAGELLRQERSSNHELHAMILETIKEGRIVPSEVTVKLLQKAIESSKNDKFLIDGFPRSQENRVAYERMIGIEPTIVAFFDCSEDEMVKRVLKRNQGRVDDNRDIVEKRIKVFRALSLPVVNYYSEKGKLYKIDGTGTEDEVFERVRPIFTARRFGLNFYSRD